MTFIASFSLKIIIYIGIYPLFSICRRTISESTCGDFFASACYKSKFTKGSTISFSSRNFNFTRDPITPSSSRSYSFTRNEPIFSPTRSFKLSKDSITPLPSRNSSFTRDESIFTSARSFKLPGIAPASPQVEASALPRTPQTPLQLVAQEIPL
jgi:hypothetical protein